MTTVDKPPRTELPESKPARRRKGPMLGRPLLRTSYEADMALFPSVTQRVVITLFLLFLVAIPFFAPGTIGESGSLPGPNFLASSDWLRLLVTLGIYAIGALGLNILTGLAGQVSLGHAFFMAVGAYTAAVFGSPPGPLWGLGLPIWVWLPLAGIIPAILGVLIAPTAVRVRGLYLAIVTLGLVFIGEYLWRNLDFITGGSQSGRSFPALEFRFWQEEEPLLTMTESSTWFGVLNMSPTAKTYLFVLVLAVLLTLLAKNLQRTRTGRAFMSIRDRDVAAEVMGVDEFRTKTVAFAISSFYAGIAGALLATFIGRTIPEQWNLLLSVEFIAIILIGGIGTVTGTLLGSAFVIILPRLVEDLTRLGESLVREGGVWATILDPLVSTGTGDWGLVNTSAGVAPGLSVDQLNLVIYGALIIAFLIFEPLGLYGIWLRIRNYWKGWPFTY
ncbi:MAG TPA: branched-chain amino acid ABC transporter permease [Acidimicrobiia bacterium]|jgi:branched-chain amino acid transport system permease protein